MFEQLLQLVKENAGQAIVKNPVIPDERNEEAIETAAGSIMNSLKGQAGGGLDSILDIFKGSGQVSSSPVIQNLTSGVAGDLMKKFGIDQAAAGNIVQQIVPVVMDKLKSKTNDPNDSSIDLEGIIGSLTGKGGGDVLGKIRGIFGG
ncbi:MAG: DUF937 domain-containing protein [Bacteroidales bacterium]|nr:DUF937 domain-containing protein [Bacteroidales bacterium]